MKILNKSFLNLFLITFMLFCIVVLNTFFVFASETINVKDYIKGKFPVIFNIYLSSLGELDEYEKEFIDLLQNLPGEEQKNYAKEVYGNGFSKDILEKIKKGNIVQDTESEIGKEEIEEFSPARLEESMKDYQINYHLSLKKEDYPEIKVEVKNSPFQISEFKFGVSGGNLGAIEDLKDVFKNIDIKSIDGKSLKYKWSDGRTIVVQNGKNSNFTIRYFVDGLNFGRSSGFSGMGEPDTKFVVFRAKRIFFVAGDVFILPNADSLPSKITVDFSLPGDTQIFSSLPKEDGKFIAVPDLWGNIVYDFQKEYFTGGDVIFSLTHDTEWGDKYIYIWFDRDVVAAAWLPSYGNTPWEQAKEYMEMTEKFAKYYREVVIEPLPKHIVLFTNVIPQVGTNMDWFHYMQIWPKYSDPEVCHHIFHQYSFFLSQSKLTLPMSHFLSEGLPTFFEQTIPSIIYGDDRYKGKLFEFFALNERGNNFGIKDNQYHIKYNIAAMKVFLLDKYIKEVTGNKKNLNDFVKELWDSVKENHKPEEMEEKQIISAFKKVVGKSNSGYLSKLIKTKSFKREDFTDLLPCFGDYVTWMADEYFWGDKLLFLVFLDIVSAKDNEWPHYATYPHNILRYRRDALIDFKYYLENVNKERFTQKDIIDAISVVTGKNHKGFFEFWKSYGFGLDPNSILLLDSWDPEERTEKEFVCSPWWSAGSLKTEDYISGHTQKAEVILDNPDDDGKIVVEVRLQSFEKFSSEDEAGNTIKGENVSLLYTSKDKYKNIFTTRAFFKIISDETKCKSFYFNLKLPSFSSHPKFLAYDFPLSSKTQLGELYWLHSFDPE
ncbi:MAG: hypothetical protein U9Q18_06275 [Caldisericota bacterium]|nr:hypothetical protein [Caldisericota bacterium]